MKRFCILYIIFIFSHQLIAQKNLSDYHFVVVPNKFKFSSEDNQYHLNDMAKFYLKKKGFVVINANEVSGNDRCEGLYASVDHNKSLFGTRLQFVLNDCNKKEIFRSEEGRSKFKEFEKAFQDALRKAMDDLPQIVDESENQSIKDEHKTLTISDILPSLQTYYKEGKTFLLRKTSKGHILYEESDSGDLNLIGDFIEDSGIKFIDTENSFFNVEMDENSNLILRNKEGIEWKFFRN